jgi:hypothetical protein
MTGSRRSCWTATPITTSARRAAPVPGIRTREEAMICMLRHQCARRNLTPYARTEVALKLTALIAVQAKQQQGPERTSSRSLEQVGPRSTPTERWPNSPPSPMTPYRRCGASPGRPTKRPKRGCAAAPARSTRSTRRSRAAARPKTPGRGTAGAATPTSRRPRGPSSASCPPSCRGASRCCRCQCHHP